MQTVKTKTQYKAKKVNKLYAKLGYRIYSLVDSLVTRNRWLCPRQVRPKRASVVSMWN